MKNPYLLAFLDGFTGRGLFTKLKYPGDSRNFKGIMTALTCGFICCLLVVGTVGAAAEYNHEKTAVALCFLLPIAAIGRLFL
jgi:hypothetical protein